MKIIAYAGMFNEAYIDTDWTGTRLAIYPKRKNAKAAHKTVRKVTISIVKPRRRAK